MIFLSLPYHPVPCKSLMLKAELPPDGMQSHPAYKLSVDRAGHFLVYTSPYIMLGGPVDFTHTVEKDNAEKEMSFTIHNHLSLKAALSRRHAKLIRNTTGYLLQPLQNTRLNNKPGESEILLRDGDLITLGEHLVLRFCQPTQLSHTARLEFTTAHRPVISCDAVLLADEVLLLGSTSACHIYVPDIKDTIMLQFGDTHFRYQPHGQTDWNTVDWPTFKTGSTIRCNEVQFHLEPINL